jgi:hypothetical protein
MTVYYEIPRYGQKFNKLQCQGSIATYLIKFFLWSYFPFRINFVLNIQGGLTLTIYHIRSWPIQSYHKRSWIPAFYNLIFDRNFRYYLITIQSRKWINQKVEELYN